VAQTSVCCLASATQTEVCTTSYCMFAGLWYYLAVSEK
jgi:hypothetical protein